MRLLEFLLISAICACPAPAQAVRGDYRLALPDHKGQLRWSVDGFKIEQSSAKPDGREIGLRGSSGRLTFLGFLFLAAGPTPLTSAACGEAALAQDKKTNATLDVLATEEVRPPDGLPVALFTYTTANRDGSRAYRVRGFVATGDLCGDLEFSSANPIGAHDAVLRRAFLGFQLDPDYTPQFVDEVEYAQALYNEHEYHAAAPIFEKALALVPPDGAPFNSALLARRVLRDQAGMSYGISGDLAKARSLFEKGVAEDPDYPLNYYNLACADAGENRLADAKVHLEQAFERKGSINPGEAMPVPTEDDSFLPYKSNQEFWSFLKHLESGK
jgi:tetratricopeptide (TPR) repeat protein